MDYLELEKESEIIQQCQSILEKISQKFETFTNEYVKMNNKEITSEELRKRIHNKLLEMSDSERYEYHFLCKMLSKTNCWWIEYEVGKIIHEEYLKILYPEEY